MTEKLLTTTETCKLLSVSRWTLNRWEDSGELNPIKTKGGHRRYKQSEINSLLQISETIPELNTSVCVYARVSSHDQKTKGDLDRQKVRILEHCLKKKYNVEHIFSEVGSGMNDKRAKLNRIFHLVRSHQICRIIVEHKDRLTRFNYSFLESFFSSHGVIIEVLEETLPKSYEAELVEDIISLMSSMSAKIYGKRASENRKKKSHLSIVSGGESCS